MIDYDEKHDVLYVAIGDKTNSYGDDSEDDVLVMRDFDTDRITGFTILSIAKKIGLQPVVHGRCPICSGQKILTQDCDNGYSVEVDAEQGEMSVWQGDTCLTVISIDYCPNCGAKMDSEDGGGRTE